MFKFSKAYYTQVESAATLALEEDAPNGDISSQLCLQDSDTATAKIIAKQPGIFFGKDILEYLCAKLQLQCNSRADGTNFKTSESLATVSGKLKNILLVERSLLNFLQHLCGIASLTKTFVDTLQDPNIIICDTRKTSPGLRYLEKAAVVAGGGHNHRLNLSDMVLIKENHIDGLGSPEDLQNKLLKFKQTYPNIAIQIEARNLLELKALPITLCNFVLLDNFSLPDLDQAIQYLKDISFAGQIEVSGNINLNTIKQYRHKAIHRISVGALTHSAPIIDLSLLLVKTPHHA